MHSKKDDGGLVVQACGGFVYHGNKAAILRYHSNLHSYNDMCNLHNLMVIAVIDYKTERLAN